MRLLSPNGHLSFAPLRRESFERGVAALPDVIAADAGSSDVGPAPLALDFSTSLLRWQRQDLEHMLLAARRLRVPMLIGSAGDTGTDSRVDLFVRLITGIAEEHHLEPFRLGWFYSEVPIAELHRRLASGTEIAGLDGRGRLTAEHLARTDRVVAMAGVHPFIDLLDRGADVIIGGRCSDAAIFAAPAIRAGFSEALSYHLGKLLECASFCAEPYGGKESVMGTISHDDIRVTAMSPAQRCTVASVSSHAMYERASPFSEYVLGGHLDMSTCRYEQFDERTTRVTGAVFNRAENLTVKLEGAARLGERCIGFAGIRDPYTIAHIDEVIAWSREQVVVAFGPDGYSLFFHRYGIDGVMGTWEPTPVAGHGVGLVVEVGAPTLELAEAVCSTASRQLFYAHLPEVKGTAGSVAYLVDEVLPARPACAWTVEHLMPVDGPLDLFPTHLAEVGVPAAGAAGSIR